MTQNGAGLDQIPEQSPQSPLLLINRPIIPYDDLNIQGHRPTFLKLFEDVGFNLAMMMGMSEQGPKMVSVSSENALRVADVGSGITSFETHTFILNNNQSVQTPFLRKRHAIAVQANMSASLSFGSFPIFYPTLAGIEVGTGNIPIGDGEAIIIDILCDGIFCANLSGVNCSYRIMAVDYVNVIDSLVQPQ